MTADQPTVLIIEDELAQREVLTYNLEADGFRVITAENGEEGLLRVDEDDDIAFLVPDAQKLQ